MAEAGASSNLTRADAEEELTVPYVRQLVRAAEAAVTANTRARAEHRGDPARFAESEIEVDAALRALSELSGASAIFGGFVDAGGLHVLLGLLGHENVDVVVGVLEVLEEISEFVGGDGEVEEYAAFYGEIVRSQLAAGVVDALEVWLCGGAQANDDVMERGAECGLAVFENMLEICPELAGELGGTRFIQVGARHLAEGMGINATVVELLAVLLQGSKENQALFARAKGISALVEAIAPYRSRAALAKLRQKRRQSALEDPEMVENMFGLLCSALLAGDDVKRDFVEADAVELMLLFVRKSHQFRSAAVKVLDFACTAYPPAVKRLAEGGGIGVIFALLLSVGAGEQPAAGKKRKRARSEDEMQSDTEHTFSVLFTLFRYADDDMLKRLLFKFWEGNGHKMVKLLLLYRHYAAAVDAISKGKPKFLLADHDVARPDEAREADDDHDDDGAKADALYLERLDAGLFIVQLAAAVVLNVLKRGPAAQRAALLKALPQMHMSETLITETVLEYVDSIEALDGDEVQLAARDEEQKRLRTLAAECGAQNETDLHEQTPM